MNARGTLGAWLFSAVCACSSAHDHPPLLSDDGPTRPTDRIPKRGAAFESADCWVTPPAEYAVDCGYVTAPAHASAPGGPSLKLAVAVVYSNASSVLRDPVVYLDGGPGAGTLKAMFAADVPFTSILEDRDLVLFDQRGTGFSTPKPTCDVSSDTISGLPDGGAASPDGGPTTAEITAIYSACHEQATADGTDLSMFRSTENAADVTAVRNALGYAEWNVYGISYGTRYALTTLRDQSKGVRAAVIDSVVPLQSDLLADQAVNVYDDLHRIAAACAAEGSCQQTYGDIEQKELSALQSMAESPPVVQRDDGTSVTVEPEIAASFFVTLMYSAETIPYIPEFVEEIYDGDYSALASATPDVNATSSSIIDTATYLSTVCAEEAPFSSRDALNARLDAVPEGFRRWFAPVGIFDACDVWNVPAAPPVDHQAVTSALPTLTFAGGFDPVTPPAYASLAAQTLTDSQSVLLAQQAHGSSISDCGEKILHAFLDNPTAQLDTSCAAGSAFVFQSFEPASSGGAPPNRAPIPPIRFDTSRHRPPPEIVEKIRRLPRVPVWSTIGVR